MSPACFRFLTWLSRRITPRYQVCQQQPVGTPAVYLVHHQNLRGPLLSMIWFNRKLRPWALSVFCEQPTCFRQYYDFTFTQRVGLPRFLAAPLAFVLSYWVSGLMPHIQAIPVYRGMQAIIKTFRQSLAALQNGENLLICPDIDYSDKNPRMGEMHKGFLLLDRFYQRATGGHVSFVPLHISLKPKCIHVGKPIRFSSDQTYKDEVSAIYDSIMQEFHRLETLTEAT